MFKIGICDDEIIARSNLRLALMRILKEENVDFYEFSQGKGAIKWIQKHPKELDILFLDVKMRGIDGLETAKQIRKKDDALFLVFVTGFADYVFQGYGVQALDYLLKPFKQEQLEAVMERVLNALRRDDVLFYTVQNSEGIFHIAQQDILYLFSDKRLLTLVTALRSYTFYGRLDDVATQLGSGFVRIHQRYLVQGKAVSEILGNQRVIHRVTSPSSHNTAEPEGVPVTLPISRGLKSAAVLELSRIMVGGI